MSQLPRFNRNDPFAVHEHFIPRGEPLPPVVEPGEFRDLQVHWCMFFASVYSLQEHPGMNRENARPKNIGECAKIADAMLMELKHRLDKGIQ